MKKILTLAIVLTLIGVGGWLAGMYISVNFIMKWW